MGLKDWKRYSRHVTRGPRWAALRHQALERDDWRCVKCGNKHRLEVDHIEPVRKRPDLAYELSNLQCLCPRHHTQKTRIEVGHPPPDPRREAWKSLVRELHRNQSSNRS